MLAWLGTAGQAEIVSLCSFCYSVLNVIFLSLDVCIYKTCLVEVSLGIDLVPVSRSLNSLLILDNVMKVNIVVEMEESSGFFCFFLSKRQ